MFTKIYRAGHAWVGKQVFLIRNTLTGKILLNIGWTTAATPVTMAFGIVQIGMMARMLGPAGMGTITLLGSICALLSGLFKITSSETIMVYAAKAESSEATISLPRAIRFCLGADALSSLVAYGSIIASAVLTPKLLKLPNDIIRLQIIYGLTIIFQSTYWTSHGLLRSMNKFSWTFYQACFYSVIKTAIVAILYFRGAGLTDVVWMLVVVSLMDSGSLLILSLFAVRGEWDRSKKESHKWWQIPRELWRFVISSHLKQIIKSMNRYVDNLIIGFMGNPTQVGYYRTGKQVCEQSITPIQGFIVSLFPEYSRLYFSGDRKKLRRIVFRFSALFLVLSVVVGAILWLNADLIVRIIFGEKFLPASGVLRVLTLWVLITFVMIPIYFLPAAVGQANPALIATMAALAVQVICIFFLAPRYGALGAAWASVAYVLTWAIVLTPSIVRILKIPLPEKQ